MTFAFLCPSPAPLLPCNVGSSISTVAAMYVVGGAGVTLVSVARSDGLNSFLYEHVLIVTIDHVPETMVVLIGPTLIDVQTIQVQQGL